MPSQNQRGDRNFTDEERRRWRPDDSQQEGRDFSSRGDHRGYYSDRPYGDRGYGGGRGYGGPERMHDSDRYGEERGSPRDTDWNYGRNEDTGSWGRTESYAGRNEWRPDQDRWEERMGQDSERFGAQRFGGQYRDQRGQVSGPYSRSSRGASGDSQYGNQYGTGQYGTDYRRTIERGPHHGKGPQSWHRSDERITEAVNEALTDHDHLDATHIEVRVKDGDVTLSGTVDDRDMKRLAEECAERVSGVKDVQNNIRVQAAAERGQARASTTAQQTYPHSNDSLQDNGKKARA